MQDASKAAGSPGPLEVEQKRPLTVKIHNHCDSPLFTVILWSGSFALWKEMGIFGNGHFWGHSPYCCGTQAPHRFALPPSRWSMKSTPQAAAARPGPSPVPPSGELDHGSWCHWRVAWWQGKVVSGRWARAGLLCMGAAWRHCQGGWVQGLPAPSQPEGPGLPQAPVCVTADRGSRPYLEEAEVGLSSVGLGPPCPKPSLLKRLRVLPKPVCRMNFITTLDTSLASRRFPVPDGCVWSIMFAVLPKLLLCFLVQRARGWLLTPHPKLFSTFASEQVEQEAVVLVLVSQSQCCSCKKPRPGGREELLECGPWAEKVCSVTLLRSWFVCWLRQVFFLSLFPKTTVNVPFVLLSVSWWILDLHSSSGEACQFVTVI